MAIEIGLQGHAETLVEKEDTAQAVGSGGLLVYATPCLAALMEGAAYESIAPELAEGESSVGTRMELTHSSATPVGMQARAESAVTAVDGRKITFEIVAYDDLIREGSMNACREKGLVRSEGKDYVMKDGDVTLFRFNV